MICAVKDRAELLQEAFLKSNRMGMLWAAPTGLGIFLFAPDLVHFVIGSRWDEAIPVIQAFGLVAVFNQIAFNWSAFFRAIGDTKPMAVGAAAMAVGVTAIAVPLLAIHGLVGFAVGMAVANAGLVAVRVGYLTRIVPLGPMVLNVARGMLPAIAAFAVTGAVRLATWGGERTELQAAAEVALFLALSLAITLVGRARAAERVPRVPSPARRADRRASRAECGRLRAWVLISLAGFWAGSGPGRRAAAPAKVSEPSVVSAEDQAIIDRARPFTMTSDARLQALVDAVRHCAAARPAGRVRRVRRVARRLGAGDDPDAPGAGRATATSTSTTRSRA